MLEKYINIKDKFNKLETSLTDPAVVNDAKKLKAVGQEYADLKEAAEKIQALEKLEKNLADTEKIIKEEKDEEMVELSKTELADIKEKINATENELAELTRPQDPMDKKNVIMEIRAGVGGDESALFAAELYRMYTKYAESLGWKAQLLSSNMIGIGGFKEVIFSIKDQALTSI